MPEEDRTSSLPPAEVADPSTHCEARMSRQGWAAGFQRWRRSSGSQPRLCAADAPARSFGPRRVVSLPADFLFPDSSSAHLSSQHSHSLRTE